MRTEGRLFVGAEVAPRTKERLRAYALNKGVSEAEALRDVLNIIFSITCSDMERYGCSEYKESEVEQ